MEGDPRSRGSKFGYKILEFFYAKLGYGFASAIAKVIVLYYFLLLPRIVASSMRFYAAVFPGAGLTARLRMTWRRFASFATVFTDRFFIVHSQSDRLHLVHDGLDEIIRKGRGQRPIIFWMSHLGNWEIATHILSLHDVPISLVIGKKQGERIEKLQKTQLGKARIKVVTLSDDNDWQSIELVKMVKSGQIVALSGDRLFNEDQRSIEVTFFGHRCAVPIGPYVLAALTDSDLAPIFGLREGRLSYRFVALPLRRVGKTTRSDRKDAMQRAAQSCFDDLEKMVRKYPEQWYNFYDFFSVPRAK
jgi:predicted LPLAT superfamily acyltransferase